MKYLFLTLIVLLPGCWQSRQTDDTTVTRHNSYSVSGTMTVPFNGTAMAMPVDLVVNHTGHEESTTESDRKSGLDPQALGQAITSAVRAGVAGLTSGSGGGLMSILGGLAPTGAVSGIGLYLAMQKRKELQMKSEYYKTDKPSVGV